MNNKNSSFVVKNEDYFTVLYYLLIFAVHREARIHIVFQHNLKYNNVTEVPVYMESAAYVQILKRLP